MNKLGRTDVHRRNAEHAESEYSLIKTFFILRSLCLRGEFSFGPRQSRRQFKIRATLTIAVQFLDVLFIVLALSGCFAVGPDYKSPDISAPAVWTAGPDCRHLLQ